MSERAPARLEVRSALEVWLTSRQRTPERLALLVRLWCEVYARDEDYTREAIEEAQRLGARHVR